MTTSLHYGCEACIGTSVRSPRNLCESHKTERRRQQARLRARQYRRRQGQPLVKWIAISPQDALDLYKCQTDLLRAEADLRQAAANQRSLPPDIVVRTLTRISAVTGQLGPLLDPVIDDLQLIKDLDPKQKGIA